MFIYAKKTSLGARFTAIVLCLAILCSGSAFSGLFFRSFLSPGPAWAEIFDYTVKEEKELGEKFNAMVRARLPIVEDPELTTYVRSIVDKLGTAMRATSFPLTVAVVRSNQANAFAGPSGYMYIFTGLILTMENESELASVIAHEMAHISQKHIAKRMREMKALSIASMLGVVAGMLLGGLTGSSDAAGAAIAGTQAAAASAMLKYSRDDENEADHVGLNYMVGGGFNPRGMPAAFDILRKQKGLKGYGNIPAYLSTHPDLTERSSYLNDRIKSLPADALRRKDDNARFKRVQTITRAYFTDPRFCLEYYKSLGGNLNCLDRLGRAIALSHTANITEAKNELEAALACGGQDALWQREAGRFYLRIKEYDLARDYLAKAMAQNPDDILTLFVYSKLIFQDGQKDSALNMMRRVFLHVPEDSEVNAAYGQMLGESGQVFKAYLHLAYAALYAADKAKLPQRIKAAKDAAKSAAEKEEFAKLESLYKERSEYLNKLR